MKTRTSVWALVAIFFLSQQAFSGNWTRGYYLNEIQRGTEREQRRSLTDNEIRNAQTQAGRDLIDSDGFRLNVAEYVQRTATNQYTRFVINRRNGETVKAVVVKTFNQSLPQDLSILPPLENQTASLTLPTYYLTQRDTHITNGTDSFQDTKSNGIIFSENTEDLGGGETNVFKHYFMDENTWINGETRTRISVGRTSENPMNSIMTMDWNTGEAPFQKTLELRSNDGITSSYTYSATDSLGTPHRFEISNGWTDGQGTDITTPTQLMESPQLFSVFRVSDSAMTSGNLQIVGSPNAFQDLVGTKLYGSNH